MSISQVITPFSGDAPNSNDQTEVVFDNNANAFAEDIVNLVPELNTWASQANATKTEINNIKSQTEALRNQASTSASSAATSATASANSATAHLRVAQHRLVTTLPVHKALLMLWVTRSTHCHKSGLVSQGLLMVT
jgi:hypothetical protein